MTGKWRVFQLSGRWLVWDGYGEFQFRTGKAALEFVNVEITKRGYAKIIRDRQEKLN